MKNLKMSAMAVALTVPLALTACGNDGGDTENTETATATSTKTSTSTSTSATSSEETTAEESAAEKAPEGQEPQAQGQTPPAIQDPIAALNATAKPVTPLEAPAASEQDIQSINNLLGGLGQQTTVKGLSTYMLDNSCQALNEASGGAQFRQQLQALPDIPLNQAGIQQMNLSQASDVKTDGNSATANVTSQITTAEGTESVTEVMYFTKGGNGQWQFCTQP